MNNIRIDKTAYAKPVRNWVDETYKNAMNTDQEAEKQTALKQVWVGINEKYNRQNLSSGDQAAAKKIELIRRINAATEGDTGRERTRDVIRLDRYDSIFQDLKTQSHGQTEEQFMQEREDAASRYNKLRQQAGKQLSKEVKEGRI
jgi:hypothetical protein